MIFQTCGVRSFTEVRARPVTQLAYAKSELYPSAVTEEQDVVWANDRGTNGSLRLHTGRRAR
jgi:hypothetical protein